MVKIKELLAGREKLEKYDELTEWKEYFSKEEVYITTAYEGFGKYGVAAVIPSHIKEIIVAALDEEIAKLDEE